MKGTNHKNKFREKVRDAGKLNGKFSVFVLVSWSFACWKSIGHSLPGQGLDHSDLVKTFHLIKLFKFWQNITFSLIS